jgi:F0F1-type ATP synthase beta subunit
MAVLAVAEYFREKPGLEVLLFVDRIFRVTFGRPARSELLGDPTEPAGAQLGTQPWP